MPVYTRLCDISRYNIANNWNQVAQNIPAVLIKCSQNTWEDRMFRQHWQDAGAVNLMRGLWHFYQPDEPPEEQAQAFLNIYTSLDQKPRLVFLDVEEIEYTDRDTGEKIRILPPGADIYTVWIARWLKIIEDALGITPGIYTRAYFWNYYLHRSGQRGAPQWNHYPLWIANYFVQTPLLPIDWTSWQFWQFSGDRDPLPGFNGVVDQDYYNGSLEQLRQLAGGLPVEPPEPPHPPATLKLTWPCDLAFGISQKFGEHPEWYAPFGLPGHEGVDFSVPEDVRILAAADGEVFQVRNYGPYGLHVRIQHQLQGVRYQTIYAHLNQANVNVGSQVRAGESIGLCGSTGNSTGPHLHLTMKIEGVQTPGYPVNVVDPMPYLRQEAAGGPAEGPFLVQIVALKGLFIRSEPDITSAKLGYFLYGEHQQISQDQNGWGKLAYQPGWVSLKYTRRI